jgi:hypothetical protein
MNPDTGQFHSEEELKRLMAEGVGAVAFEKARSLGWMELNLNEVIKIKGHDFKVMRIGKDAVRADERQILGMGQNF